MRKVVAGLFNSLDGVVRAPNEGRPTFDSELNRLLEGPEDVLVATYRPVR